MARPAHWKFAMLGQCVVVRQACVIIRYSFVERAGPTLDQRYAFVVIRCVRRFFFQHAQKCARSSTHECTRQRHARHTWNVNARPSPDIPGEHTPCIRTARQLHAVHFLSARQLFQNLDKSQAHGLFRFPMRGPCVVERGACVDHSSSTLATGCAFVEVVIMCALCTVCMRTVCALYALSALAARYAFGVSSLQLGQKLGARQRTGQRIANFPCAGRAFPMRPLCVTGPLARLSYGALSFQGINSYQVPIYFTWVECGKCRSISCQRTLVRTMST